MKAIVAISVLSALVTVGRFFIPGHDLSWPGTYEAIAHMWVGALLVWCFQKERVKRITSWSCLMVSSLVEVVMFMSR
ncbi:hypothetical protein BH10PLA2_BH10PLA2_23410 [soil metagenome]